MMRDAARGKRPLDNDGNDDIADDALPVPKRRDLTHTVLAERYHIGGAVVGDSTAVAAARQELARIQRDHRLRRRDDEEPSQTPGLDELVYRQVEDRDVDGDDGDDADNGDNGDNGDMIQNGDVGDVAVHADGSTIQHRRPGRPRKHPLPDLIDVPRRLRGRPRKEPDPLAPPPRPRGRPRKEPAAPIAIVASAQPAPAAPAKPDPPRRPRGRPRKERPPPPAEPPRRGRPPKPRRPVGRPRKDRVNDPPRDFDEAPSPPPPENKMQQPPLSEKDMRTKREFDARLAEEAMRYCTRCKERWFDVVPMDDGVCKRCHLKDDKKRIDEPFYYSADNHLDFGDVPDNLPSLCPAEEMVIAKVHVAINVFTVRGQQYNYRGHVVHFLRDVGKIYHELPLLPKDLDIVILRPAGATSNPAMDRQFRKRFRIRRRVVALWLDFLARNHPGYRNFRLSKENLSQLPDDDSIFDQLTIHEVTSLDGLAADQGPVEEQLAENEDGLACDEAAVPNIVVKESELSLLQGKLDETTDQNEEQPPMRQQLPKMHTTSPYRLYARRL